MCKDGTADGGRAGRRHRSAGATDIPDGAQDDPDDPGGGTAEEVSYKRDSSAPRTSQNRRTEAMTTHLNPNYQKNPRVELEVERREDMSSAQNASTT